MLQTHARTALALTLSTILMGYCSICEAKTKVEDVTVDVDDCALAASRASMDNFSSACNNFGLPISIKKTEALYQPAPGKPYTEPM